MYPAHYKAWRAPEINLPFGGQMSKVIRKYFDITNVLAEDDPQKNAVCKTCGKAIMIIVGSSPYSSYTRCLKYHLKTHSLIWEDYLHNLSKVMTPDTKTKLEHFKQMQATTKITNSEKPQQRLEECRRNSMLNPKNLAKVQYSQRDSEFLRNDFDKLAESENARMFEYLFNFTNRNLTLYDLMGTKNPGANLQTNYKKSKCLVENFNNLTIDLERYLCEHKCFFDPILYENCPNFHTGDIAIFTSEQFQSSFPNFQEEIEKYPEFQDGTNLNIELLKNTSVIERDKKALVEMNLLLKILISMIKIRKNQPDTKIDDLISEATDENNLIKPELAIQMWGPRYTNLDTTDEYDATKNFSESRFSTFQHKNDSECPAYSDTSKKIYTKPFIRNEKVFYPCNVGGCAKACMCPPCSNDSEMRCPDHHPDHPELFDHDEDLHHSRRILFLSKTKEKIFKRPIVHPNLCPPKLNLAGLKKNCQNCRKNLENHLKHHFVLHSDVCEICYYKEYISKNSFELVCYVCMKKFENTYRLKDHMKIHDKDQNPYSCKICDIGFTTKFVYERHIMEHHKGREQSFDCEECGKTYTAERNLKRHIETKHTNNSKYTCELCEKQFDWSHDLRRHRKFVHQIDEKRVNLPGININSNYIECYICKKIFNGRSNLNRHLETVHNDNCEKYECQTCGKMFKTKFNLKRHMETHIQIICEICLKHFKSKDGLKAHRIANHED